MPVVAFDAAGIFSQAIVAKTEFVPDFGVICVSVGTEFKGSHGFGEPVVALQGHSPVKIGFIVEGVILKRHVIGFKRLTTAPEAVQRHPAVDDRFGIDGVELERFLIRDERLFVPPQIVQ